MFLLSLNLTKPISRNSIEYTLDVSLTRGVENSYYGQNTLLQVVIASFDVLTLIADDKTIILQALEKLGLKLRNQDDDFIYQDYPIEINPEQTRAFIITNEAIILKNPSSLNLKIIALAISQSVGLERYEKQLAVLFSQNREVIESISSFTRSRRKQLLNFVQKLTLMRHNMVENLLLLDKPNILWDNEEAENLYNAITRNLELDDRHEIALAKLSQIKEDAVLVMDLLNHKQSEFLEWIIIVLIGVEIVMGLIEFF